MSSTAIAGRSPFTGQELALSCYIDGRWVEGVAEQSARVVNPATEALLADVRFASVGQVESAVVAAKRALDGAEWRSFGPRERSRLLHAYADAFEAASDELVDAMVDETGSTLVLARVAQVNTAIEVFRWFADAALRGPEGGYEKGIPLFSAPGLTAGMLVQEPVGVVASITAYNYPLLLLARKLGGVLASGCTTVVMPSERAPLTTIMAFRLLEQLGLPQGVANLVVGGIDAGQALTTHPAVDLVTFTGSVKVGEAVMRQGATGTKRVVLELGGKSPTILLPGAMTPGFVPWSVLRYSVHAGQGCGCTTRTLISRDDYDEYVDTAAKFVGTLKVGDPRDESNAIGPLIRAEHRAMVEGYVDRALEAGGTILGGGGRPDTPAGYFMNPTIIGDLDNSAEIAQEELFGPVGVVMPFDSIDEAIQIANDSKYGLNAAVWGEPEFAMQVARRLRSGTVAINGGGGFNAAAPWGGFRASGIGRESGEDGFREFFEVKFLHWPIGAPGGKPVGMK